MCVFKKPKCKTRSFTSVHCNARHTHVHYMRLSSCRADADRDASRENSEDHAARLRPGVEGEPPDGRRKAGLSVSPLGKPPRPSHELPVSSQRAAARKPRPAQRQELHHQQTGRRPDRTGMEATRTLMPTIGDGADVCSLSSSQVKSERR